MQLICNKLINIGIKLYFAGVTAALLWPPAQLRCLHRRNAFKHWTVTFCGRAVSRAKKTWLSPTLLLSPWNRQWDQLYGLLWIGSCIALTQAPPLAGEMISRNKTAEIRCWPQPSPSSAQHSPGLGGLAMQCSVEWCTLDMVFNVAYLPQCRTPTRKGLFSPMDMFSGQFFHFSLNFRWKWSFGFRPKSATYITYSGNDLNFILVCPNYSLGALTARTTNILKMYHSPACCRGSAQCLFSIVHWAAAWQTEIEILNDFNLFLVKHKSLYEGRI